MVESPTTKAKERAFYKDRSGIELHNAVYAGQCRLHFYHYFIKRGLQLQQDRLDYTDKPCEVIIGEPKNGKHRVIQMTAEIKAVLDKVKALGYTNVDDFVFVRKDGTRYTGHTIGCATARRAEDAGIKRTSIHGIRRIVSSLLNTVLPQKAVADMLGHSERVNELCYNYSMAENAEKKRALEEMFSKVFIFSEYVSENKKIGNG
jgi:integrase